MFPGRIYPNSTGVDYFYDLASRVYQVNDPTEGVLHKKGSTVLDARPTPEFILSEVEGTKRGTG